MADAWETRFRELQAARYGEWLRATRAWMFGRENRVENLSPYLILVHSSEGNPEKHLLPILEEVRSYGNFPVQGGGAAVGRYRGAEIWILHQYMGCTASQMWLELLAGSPVRYLIGLAEMTAYDAPIAIGDIVLPTWAERGDLVTRFHAPPEESATADPKLVTRLANQLAPTEWPVHQGPVYSGMPGGVGVHNPILREKIWRQMQAGLLGNAIEVSVTYLEAQRLGIRCASAWAVSDDLSVGLLEGIPEGQARWQQAWALIAKAALDVLAELHAEAHRV